MKEIDLIPFGQKNRISKEELARKLNISIKEINSIVSELRKKYIILSDTKVGGYWRPDTKQELLDFIREHNSRHFAESGLIQMAWNEIDKLKK
jgi:biotin operon repressor